MPRYNAFSFLVLILATFTTGQPEYYFGDDPLVWIDNWNIDTDNTSSGYDWNNFTLTSPPSTEESVASTADFIEWLASRIIPDDDDNRTSSFFGGFFQFNFEKNTLSSSFEYAFISSLQISPSQCHHTIHSITSALDTALRRANPAVSTIQSRPKRVDQQPCSTNATCPCPHILPPRGRRALVVSLELETVSSSSALTMPAVMPLGISFSSEKAVRRLSSPDSQPIPD